MPRTHSKCSVIFICLLIQTNNQLYSKFLIIVSLCWLYQHLLDQSLCSNHFIWIFHVISQKLYEKAISKIILMVLNPLDKNPAVMLDENIRPFLLPFLVVEEIGAWTHDSSQMTRPGLTLYLFSSMFLSSTL